LGALEAGATAEAAAAGATAEAAAAGAAAEAAAAGAAAEAAWAQAIPRPLQETLQEAATTEDEMDDEMDEMGEMQEAATIELMTALVAASCAAIVAEPPGAASS
jgi:spore coat protein CotH